MLFRHSSVVNVVGYRVIALDFDLWSRTKKEIQQVYLDHFITLLRTSRYKSFNAKQRLSKMGVVRKVLFALQADWYHGDLVDNMMEVLKVTAETMFSKEETIKPLVSYLAANLHEGMFDTRPVPRFLLTGVQARPPAQHRRTQLSRNSRLDPLTKKLNACSRSLSPFFPNKTSTSSSSPPSQSLASASSSSASSLHHSLPSIFSRLSTYACATRPLSAGSSS